MCSPTRASLLTGRNHHRVGNGQIAEITIEAEVPANASGVLYKLGSNAGGLTLWAEDGILCYEYNLFIVQRTQIRATKKLPAGNATVEVATDYVVPRPAGPLKITLRANGEKIGEGTVPISAPLIFTANDCLDIGSALGSTRFARLSKESAFQFQRQDQTSECEIRAPKLGCTTAPAQPARALPRDNSLSALS